MSVMTVRRNIIPKNPGDIVSMLFILTAIPLIFYFEICIVLPNFYDSYSPWFIIHLLCGTFTVINIVGNYVATLITDTSYSRKSDENAADSMYSEPSYEDPTIPRSWYCNSCKVTILKRDHHCIFVGYCIGHFNHRYFIWLLFYLFIGTLHGTYLNIFFVIENFDYNPLLITKLIFPLSFVLFGLDKDVNHTYLIVILIAVVGAFITGILLCYHVKLILKGTTCHENARKDFTYNLGTKENIKRVFGEKWYLTWISAFVGSRLLEDGKQWTMKVSKTL